MGRSKLFKGLDLTAPIFTAVNGAVVYFIATAFYRKVLFYDVPSVVLFGCNFALMTLTIGSISALWGSELEKLNKNIVTGTTDVTVVPLYILALGVVAFLLGAVGGVLYNIDSAAGYAGTAALFAVYGMLCGALTTIAYADNNYSTFPVSLTADIITSVLGGVLLFVCLWTENENEVLRAAASALAAMSFAFDSEAPTVKTGPTAQGIGETKRMTGGGWRDRLAALVSSLPALISSLLCFLLSMAWIILAIVLPRVIYFDLYQCVQDRIDEELVEEETTASDRFTNELCGSITFTCAENDKREPYTVAFTYPDAEALLDEHTEMEFGTDAAWNFLADEIENQTAPMKTETVTFYVKVLKDDTVVIVDNDDLLDVLSGGLYETETDGY